MTVALLQASPEYHHGMVRICPDCGPNDEADFYQSSNYCKACLAKRVKDNRHKKGVMPRVPQAATIEEYDLRNPIRQCSACGHTMSISDFSPAYRPRNGRWERAYSCRDCTNTYSRNWGKTQDGARSIRNSVLKSQYGIDIEIFESRITSQDGKCPICSNPFDGRKGSRQAVVDHDHSTGVVRGVICWTCNTVLGRLEDNVNTLRQMIIYLGG